MTIELRGLVVFGHHGYLEEERRLGQRFLVDLWVDVHGEASDTDRIEDTVDYRRLAALVREVFAGRERLLLEGLAGAIADGIVERFSAVERVRVRVRKPDVVLDPPVDYAAVVVERARDVTRAYVGLGANLGDRARRRCSAPSSSSRRPTTSRCSPSRGSARPIRSASSTSRRS